MRQRETGRLPGAFTEQDSGLPVVTTERSGPPQGVKLPLVRFVHALRKTAHLTFRDHSLYVEIIVAGELSKPVRLAVSVLLCGTLSWRLRLTIVPNCEPAVRGYRRETQHATRNRMLPISRAVATRFALCCMACGPPRSPGGAGDPAGAGACAGQPPHHRQLALREHDW
jgi:hypothetical protein